MENLSIFAQHSSSAVCSLVSLIVSGLDKCLASNSCIYSHCIERKPVLDKAATEFVAAIRGLFQDFTNEKYGDILVGDELDRDLAPCTKALNKVLKALQEFEVTNKTGLICDTKRVTRKAERKRKAVAFTNASKQASDNQQIHFEIVQLISDADSAVFVDNSHSGSPLQSFTVNADDASTQLTENNDKTQLDASERMQKSNLERLPEEIVGIESVPKAEPTSSNAGNEVVHYDLTNDAVEIKSDQNKTVNQVTSQAPTHQGTPPTNSASATNAADDEFWMHYQVDLCNTCNDDKVHTGRGRAVKKALAVSLSCRECKKKFSSKQALRNHRVKHLKPFSCAVCLLGFANRSSLQAHENIHSGEAPYECSVCHKGFRTQHVLSDHMRYHRERVVCEYCSRTFTKKANLLRHVETQHAGSDISMDKKHFCFTCDVAFCFYSTYKSHMIKEHPDCDLALKDRLRCRRCRVQFTDESSLRQHAPACMEESVQCESCDKVFANTILLNSHRLHHSRHDFACSFCPQRFVKRYDLKSHVARRHTNDRPMKCEFCFKGFVTKTELEKHVVTHTGRSNHRCSHCKKCFVSAVGLRRHVDEIHLRIAKHMCELCGENFRSNRDLQNHIARHDDNKPFKCKYCKKGFSWEAGLKRHVIAHESGDPSPAKLKTSSSTGATKYNGPALVNVLESRDVQKLADRDISAQELSAHESAEIQFMVDDNQAVLDNVLVQDSAMSASGSKNDDAIYAQDAQAYIQRAYEEAQRTGNEIKLIIYS